MPCAAPPASRRSACVSGSIPARWWSATSARPGRVNFTVVGDTVNIAQRFEQLGKEFMKEGEEIVVLASGSTMGRARARCSWPWPASNRSCGSVKGHDDPVEVYRPGVTCWTERIVYR
jgi:class 3 adenylate cyclase